MASEMPDSLWIAALILAALGLGLSLYLRLRRPKGLFPAALGSVSFDASGILSTDTSGKSRRVPWNQLTRVSIRTTDDGPMGADVFWTVHAGGEEPSIVFPGGVTGEAELLREFQRRLQGFDNDRLIDAMASTSNADFVLWESTARATS